MEKVVKWTRNHQAVLFPILDVLLNGGNFLIHFYMSWYLIPSQYGTLNALLSLLALLMVIGVSVQITTAATYARSEQKEWTLRWYKGFAIRAAFIISFILTSVTPFMIRFFRSSTAAYLLVIICFFIQVPLSFMRGIMQGKGTFLQLNFSFYIEMVIKLIGTALLLKWFRTIEMALLSVALGLGASVIHAYLESRKFHIKTIDMKEITRKERKNNVYTVAKTFATQFFFYYFTAAAIILTHYFYPKESGIYALGMRYTQISLYVALSVMTVFIPSLSQLKHDVDAFQKYAKKILLLAFQIGIPGLTIYLLASQKLMPLLFHSAYAGARQIFVIQAFAYFALAIVMVASTILMIMDSRKYIHILTAGSIVLIVGIAGFGHTLYQIAMVECTLYTALSILLVRRILMRRS